ncbi:MAG: glucose 1-dehydrogenase [Flammeovirgaceae bacterium]|nr:glucose 1-dehydrogenase [Flammeovirgaceae bacterium]
MEQSLKGKVALITGASKGIGKSIAYLFGKAGAKVILSSRKQDAVDEVALDFKREGIEVGAIACNMGKMEEVKQLFEKSKENFEKIDILVNNAATNPIFGPVEDATTEAFDKIMDVNVKGPFLISKLVYPIMKENGGGAIINISSIEGITPGFGLGLYSVSKSALIMLSKVTAKEWGKHKIRVNTICPGLIKTKFSEALWSNEKIMSQVFKMQPIQDIGKPEDIASLALMLASDAGSFCTGAVFTADGGLTI